MDLENFVFFVQMTVDILNLCSHLPLHSPQKCPLPSLWFSGRLRTRSQANRSLTLGFRNGKTFRCTLVLEFHGERWTWKKVVKCVLYCIPDCQAILVGYIFSLIHSFCKIRCAIYIGDVFLFIHKLHKPQIDPNARNICFLFKTCTVNDASFFEMFPPVARPPSLYSPTMKTYMYPTNGSQPTHPNLRSIFSIYLNTEMVSILSNRISRRPIHLFVWFSCSDHISSWPSRCDAETTTGHV